MNKKKSIVKIRLKLSACYGTQEQSKRYILYYISVGIVDPSPCLLDDGATVVQ